MDWTLQMITLPVGDIDRSVQFYRDKVGFHLDRDIHNEDTRVVQLTPEGSRCSIVFGDLSPQREMKPGSIRGLQLYVQDAEAFHAELVSHGVEAGEIMWNGEANSFKSFSFADPDGNSWTANQMVWP